MMSLTSKTWLNQEISWNPEDVVTQMSRVRARAPGVALLPGRHRPSSGFLPGSRSASAAGMSSPPAGGGGGNESTSVAKKREVAEGDIHFRFSFSLKKKSGSVRSILQHRQLQYSRFPPRFCVRGWGRSQRLTDTQQQGSFLRSPLLWCSGETRLRLFPEITSVFLASCCPRWPKACWMFCIY